MSNLAETALIQQVKLWGIPIATEFSTDVVDWSIWDLIDKRTKDRTIPKMPYNRLTGD